MGLYCFRREDTDELIEEFMSISELEDRLMMLPSGRKGIKLNDGVFAHQDLAAQHRDIETCPGNWPLLSNAFSVHPSQIKEAREHAKQHGIELNFKKDGRAIFRDRDHRRKCLKSHGFVDHDGGYSD